MCQHGVLIQRQVLVQYFAKQPECINLDLRSTDYRKLAEAIDYAARVRASHPEMQVVKRQEPQP